ncbi:MAG TPA: hypothetical protein VGD98_13240, partial [Ktedonobacteraceae bacterium]
ATSQTMPGKAMWDGGSCSISGLSATIAAEIFSRPGRKTTKRVEPHYDIVGEFKNQARFE